MKLPRYTWDQADLLGLMTAQGFAGLGIKPATVRKWAHRDAVAPVGLGPGGAKLYAITDVLNRAGKDREVGIDTYTMVVFRRGGRPDDEILSDPSLLNLWAQHVRAAGAEPITSNVRMTITHGPPRTKGLRLVRDGVPDVATVAVRITGKGRHVTDA